jgi:hypothetical protein
VFTGYHKHILNKANFIHVLLLVLKEFHIIELLNLGRVNCLFPVSTDV